MPTIAFWLIIAVAIIATAVGIYETCIAIGDKNKCRQELHQLAAREINLDKWERELEERENELKLEKAALAQKKKSKK